MLKKFYQNRIIRFLFFGAITAVFNVVLIAGLIESLDLEESLHRNLANVVSIEISVFFSFLVYRLWVWSSPQWNLKQMLRREVPLYHLSCAAAIVIRSFLLFPILDWLGLHYVANTLVGIIVGSGFNYTVNDRVVFKSR
ncbi:GtrA family protein [filamentous cyanobacterium CCP2]|nr:GtrA family protein [filamentous cyanobacterium CCP2]